MSIATGGGLDLPCLVSPVISKCDNAGVVTNALFGLILATRGFIKKRRSPSSMERGSKRCFTNAVFLYLNVDVICEAMQSLTRMNTGRACAGRCVLHHPANASSLNDVSDVSSTTMQAIPARPSLPGTVTPYTTTSLTPSHWDITLVIQVIQVFK